MDNNKIYQQLVYKKAGKFILIPYTGNTPDRSKQYIECGIVDTIQKTQSKNTVDMNDGNSQYAAHTYVQTEDLGLDIKFNTYSPALEAKLNGYVYATGSDADQTIEKIYEYTIDADGFSLVGSEPVTENGELQLFVCDNKGNVFTSTTSTTPTTGEFYYDTATTTVEFAAADIGTEVAIDVITTSSDVIEIYSDETPSLPKFQVRIVGEIEGYEEDVIYDTVCIMDKVVCTNATPPVRSNDPTQGWSISLKTQKPRAGHKPYDVRIAPRA